MLALVGAPLTGGVTHFTITAPGGAVAYDTLLGVGNYFETLPLPKAGT